MWCLIAGALSLALVDLSPRSSLDRMLGNVEAGTRSHPYDLSAENSRDVTWSNDKCTITYDSDGMLVRVVVLKDSNEIESITAITP